MKDWQSIRSLTNYRPTKRAATVLKVRSKTIFLVGRLRQFVGDFETLYNNGELKMSSASKFGNSTKKYLQGTYKQSEAKQKPLAKTKTGVEKDHSSALEFMKVALLRNDESIRYSESKAGFLFSFTGIIVGLFYNEISIFKTLLFQKNLWGLLTTIAIAIIIVGVIVVTFSTFMVVIPRLRVSKIPTLLYFGYIQNIPESALYDIAANLDSVKALKDLTTQVRVTSIIVSKKYYYVRIGIFGALSVFMGWIMATSIIFLTQ